MEDLSPTTGGDPEGWDEDGGNEEMADVNITRITYDEMVRIDQCSSPGQSLLFSLSIQSLLPTYPGEPSRALVFT